MERSALSGKEIEGGTTLAVSFEDGISRELVVSTDEAEELRSKGRNVSAWYVYLARRVARPGAWVLGLAVTSLLIPAITKQWADRPRELELRISLIDELGESAARTINTARFIVADTLPEASLRRLACAQGDQAPDARRMELCEAAVREETRAEQTAHIEAKTTWLQKGAVLESQLAAYFPSSELAREGKAYVNAVRIYLFLASGVCETKRDEANTKLLRYLGEDPGAPEWGPLYSLTPEECQQKSNNLAFREIYGPLGDRMLAERLDLLRLLNESNAAGFSTGLVDFFFDALPALALLAMAVIYLALYAWNLRRQMRRPGIGGSTG